jgi:hypothetical protein
MIMSDVEFKVSEDLIKGIVSEKMKIAIVEAMGGRDRLVESIVNAYMECKVNADGTVDRYGSYNTHKRSDVMVRELIESAMREALKEHLQTRQEEIKQALCKYLNSKAGTSMIVKAVADGFANSMSDNGWKWNMSFNLQRPER